MTNEGPKDWLGYDQYAATLWQRVVRAFAQDSERRGDTTLRRTRIDGRRHGRDMRFAKPMRADDDSRGHDAHA